MRLGWTMKVVFVSRRFYPDVTGGGQISALYIAKSLVKRDVDVKVLTFNDEDKVIKEKIEGVSITRLPIKRYGKSNEKNN